MQQVNQDGVFRFGAAERLFGVERHVLEGAVPPVPDLPSAPGMYGWVGKGLPMPGTGGAYVVEFEGEREFRVLAYVDPFGRAFAMRVPSTMPPARVPDLTFVKLPDQPRGGDELGFVCVNGDDGSQVEVAQYRCARGRYTLFDSWFDFGPYGSNLSYNDAVSRAFLAFVHRPSLGASAAPERGLKGVHERLRSDKPIAALRGIVEEVWRADRDVAFRPPALVCCLARWLADAGLDDLAGVGDEALRIVRTVRYANTYYVGIEDEDAGIEPKTAWALEAALNRFLLIEEAFGESAAVATDVDCARWDEYLIETVATQRPAGGALDDAPEGAAGGEWQVRCALGATIERLRLPMRVDVGMRCDVAEGVAAFELVAPDGSLMPSWLWRDGAGWVQPADEQRAEQARRYALHLGLALACAAFEASPSILRVDLVARPLAEASEDGEGEFPPRPQPPVFAQVSFDRAAYERAARFEGARAGDPVALYASCGARFDVAVDRAFASIEQLASARRRADRPEASDEELAGPARIALAADRCRDMRIVYDAARRRVAEKLADDVVRASSAAEAIRLVRSVQDEATARGDDRAVAACTRLMAALADGGIDMGDQNAVVGRFLGEDRCLVALGRARALAESDADEAVRVLIEAVDEAAALDGFVDGALTVHRDFDSYAARALYNRARRGDGAPVRAFADADRSVELVPDSFYLCHLEITQLLEHSFERTEEALRYGQRAIELAPTTAAGYRQLGRAYMLVGDMENAAAVLREGLLVAVQPNDIAVAYYQLAYVLWKAGRAQAGAACYLKSLMTSSAMALQATAELQELVEETGVALPGKEEVDDELAEHDVPIAPTGEVLEALGAGAVAAVEEGLFPVARNLLALRLRYRPDDALVNVLRSLEE